VLFVSSSVFLMKKKSIFLNLYNLTLQENTQLALEICDGFIAVANWDDICDSNEAVTN
jgi:hypothetical protein